MLPEKTRSIVKATVPALKLHGEAITSHFYALMLSEHPELKAFFNETHQREGTQARALAGAVLAYAEHIDRLVAIAPALPRIIQKHVALGIRPDHYPIVGSALLRAIRAVLGDAATDEVMQAWADAYGSLADLLIHAEEEVYAATEATPGGWRGTRRFRVTRKERESELITSFYLEPVDGAPLLKFRPGQFLTLVLDLKGREIRRNYSLSDAPGKPWYRISVKREPGGEASNWLHDRLHAGMTVDVLPPAGEFILDESSTRPIVLVTGGVGITPALSMLEAAADSGRSIHFIHAALHSGVHAFRHRVEQLASLNEDILPLFLYDEPREDCPPHQPGRVTQALLEQVLPADRDVDLYFLGPKGFMKAMFGITRDLGIPPAQVRFEFFGPLEVMTG
ncbi:MAG: NO-inducible flavohemoprotein [Rubrivivax sp.]|nr:MAG: NO-inducible flavohemoprotein [Rubrivivax sp.]